MATLRDERIDGEYDRPSPERNIHYHHTKADHDRLKELLEKYSKDRKTSEVTIQEKFETSMGLVLRVVNDRTFKVNQVVETEEGQYIVRRILFPTNTGDERFVNILVERA